MIRRGTTQEKILLLLVSGLALGLSRSPKGYYKILETTHKAWREIDERNLRYSINSLYKSKLINQKNNRDGTTTFFLSKEGRQVALTYNLDNIRITKHAWDKKWRMVTFDIPEKLKKVRDSLRFQLKRLGFIEFQRSVFILPFECRDEIEYIVEFYNVRRFVRFIEASHIDNELDLKHKFNLS